MISFQYHHHHHHHLKNIKHNHRDKAESKRCDHFIAMPYSHRRCNAQKENHKEERKTREKIRIHQQHAI